MILDDGRCDMALLERTYQASDLAGTGRREFLDEAKAGTARLRDTDGTSLIMLPEGQLNFLTMIRVYIADYLALETTLNRARDDRAASDFGGLAWAIEFDDDDLSELRREYAQELSKAVAARDATSLERCLHAWHMTASTLSDPVSRDILEGRASDDADFVDLARPTIDG